MLTKHSHIYYFTRASKQPVWWAGQWLWCLFERRGNRGSKKLSNLHKVTEQVRRRSATKLRSSDSQPQGLPVLFLCLLPTTAAHKYVSLLFLPISLPFSLQVTNDFLVQVVIKFIHFSICIATTLFQALLSTALDHCNSNLLPAFRSPPVHTAARVIYNLAIQSSISTTRETITNVGSQAPTQTYWLRIWILMRSQMIHVQIKVWESREWEDKPQVKRTYLQKIYLIKNYFPKYMKNS